MNLRKVFSTPKFKIMGIYNNKETNPERICPITGESLIDSGFATPYPNFDGYQYILPKVNKDVIVGISMGTSGDDRLMSSLREYSKAILRIIKDSEKSFMEIDRALLSEIKRNDQTKL